MRNRYYQLLAWMRRILGKPKKKYPTYKAKSKKPARGKMTRARYARLWLIYQLRRFIHLASIAGALAFLILWFTLPSIDELADFKKKTSIIITSTDGQIITSYGDVYGRYVPFAELPKSLVDAVLATEDRNFYYHPGVDPIGLLRATIANFRAGKVVQGGSTLTQQVAKNVFLTPERSFMRKLREMLLAFKLEWSFSKEEIITIYVSNFGLRGGFLLSYCNIKELSIMTALSYPHFCL